MILNKLFQLSFYINKLLFNANITRFSKINDKILREVQAQNLMFLIFNMNSLFIKLKIIKVNNFCNYLPNCNNFPNNLVPYNLINYIYVPVDSFVPFNK